MLAVVRESRESKVACNKGKGPTLRGNVKGRFMVGPSWTICNPTRDKSNAEIHCLLMQTYPTGLLRAYTGELFGRTEQDWRDSPRREPA